jgi:hypothetical protein
MSKVLVVEHGPEIGQVTAFCYSALISMAHGSAPAPTAVCHA